MEVLVYLSRDSLERGEVSVAWVQVLEWAAAPAALTSCQSAQPRSEQDKTASNLLSVLGISYLPFRMGSFSFFPSIVHVVASGLIFVFCRPVQYPVNVV